LLGLSTPRFRFDRRGPAVAGSWPTLAGLFDIAEDHKATGRPLIGRAKPDLCTFRAYRCPTLEPPLMRDAESAITLVDVNTEAPTDSPPGVATSVGASARSELAPVASGSDLQGDPQLVAPPQPQNGTTFVRDRRPRNRWEFEFVAPDDRPASWSGSSDVGQLGCVVGDRRDETAGCVAKRSLGPIAFGKWFSKLQRPARACNAAG
jgi:hypothetical protein